MLYSRVHFFVVDDENFPNFIRGFSVLNYQWKFCTTLSVGCTSIGVPALLTLREPFDA